LKIFLSIIISIIILFISGCTSSQPTLNYKYYSSARSDKECHIQNMDPIKYYKDGSVLCASNKNIVLSTPYSTIYKSKTNIKNNNASTSIYTKNMFIPVKSDRECYDQNMYPIKYYKDGSVLCASNKNVTLPTTNIIVWTNRECYKKNMYPIKRYKDGYILCGRNKDITSSTTNATIYQNSTYAKDVLIPVLSDRECHDHNMYPIKHYKDGSVLCGINKNTTLPTTNSTISQNQTNTKNVLIPVKSDKECYDRNMYPIKHYKDGSVLCGINKNTTLPTTNSTISQNQINNQDKNSPTTVMIVWTARECHLKNMYPITHYKDGYILCGNKKNTYISAWSDRECHAQNMYPIKHYKDGSVLCGTYREENFK
jgi:hypothetical protein